MAVKKAGEKYRCNICGDEVTLTQSRRRYTRMLGQTHRENRLEKPLLQTVCRS